MAARGGESQEPRIFKGAHEADPHKTCTLLASTGSCATDPPLKDLLCEEAEVTNESFDSEETSAPAHFNRQEKKRAARRGVWKLLGIREEVGERAHTVMQTMFSTRLAWLCALALSLAIYPAWLQKPPKKTATSGNSKAPGCCEELRKLKVQVANLSSLMAEMSKTQEDALGNAVVRVMELEGSFKLMDTRLHDVEGKYSEISHRLGIVQLQAAQAATQTSTDAVYDCSSLYQRNYRSSGIYKLLPDEFLGTPELQVYCDMETDGGGWTVIQRRNIGLISFSQNWKQYKEGFGSLQGDFWLGNEHIYRLSRRPTMLRVELEDWQGNTRFAQYNQFALGNELNSYRLFLANFSGNVPRDSMRYHNNTAFSTRDKDNDKCVDHCAQLRQGGYWYNCCTDSNLNGVYYREEEHNKSTDGITWYGWRGNTYSLKRVEMKIRPSDFSAQRDPNRVE